MLARFGWCVGVQRVCCQVVPWIDPKETPKAVPQKARPVSPGSAASSSKVAANPVAASSKVSAGSAASSSKVAIDPLIAISSKVAPALTEATAVSTEVPVVSGADSSAPAKATAKATAKAAAKPVVAGGQPFCSGGRPDSSRSFGGSSSSS